jgi:hypothetical protein
MVEYLFAAEGMEEGALRQTRLANGINIIYIMRTNIVMAQ